MSMAPKPKQSEILSSPWERLRASATSYLAREVSMLVHPLRVLEPDTLWPDQLLGHLRGFLPFLMPQN